MALHDSDISALLRQFPPIDFGFAYGSGVVEQHGYEYSKAAELPMVDLVFVVKNSEEWHHKNLLINADHYTSLLPTSLLNTSNAAKLISYVQDHMGAGYWYNAHIPMNITRYPQRLMKYGVVSRDRILKDLHQWTDMYGAGRLHKPVKILQYDEEIENAITINRENAVRTALLLLPRQFNETDVYLKIASLSYIGDPRMYVGGENPRKVFNLVLPKVPLYQQLYKKIFDKIAEKANVQLISEQARQYTQDVSHSSRWNLAIGLPLTMRRLLLLQGRKRYLNSKPPNKTAIKSALSSIVARAAGPQSFKGLITAGVFKSATYLYSKFSKGLFRRSGTSSFSTLAFPR